MDYSQVRITLTNWLQTNRAIVLRICLVIFAFVILYVLLSFRIVTVEVTGAEGKTAIISRRIEEPPESPNKSILNPGRHIVRSGTYTIEASSNKGATSTDIKPRVFSSNRVTLDIKPQRAVDTFAYANDGTSCVFGDLKNAYTCKDGGVYSYDPANQQTEQIHKDVSLTGKQVAYKNGILSFATSSVGVDEGGKTSLLFISGRSKKEISLRKVELPSDLGMLTVVTSPGSDTFGVHNSENDVVYIYRNLVDKTPTAVEYRGDPQDNTVVETVSVFNNKVAVNVFEDTSSRQESSEEHEDEHPDYRSWVLVYDTTSDGDSEPEEIEISKLTKDSESSGDTWLVADDTLLSLSTVGTAYLVDISDGARITTRVYSVGDVTYFDNALVYTQGGSVIKRGVDSQTSHILRRLDDSTFGSLTVVNKQLLFSGRSQKDVSKPSYYVITNDEKPMTDPFSHFPYSLDDIPILNSWYHGNDFYFSVKLNSLVFGRNLPQATYDATEYKLKQDVITRRLTTDGFDLNKYTVNFHPGP